MAYEAWVIAHTEWCETTKAKADMMEHRVFPAEVMPDFPGYRVLARKCSLATACNLAGLSCKWAYTEPRVDPFGPTV